MHGALQDKVTYNHNRVNFLKTFVVDYKEGKIQRETFPLGPVLVVSKDGIEIADLSTERKDQLVMMRKKFGMLFNKTREDLR